MNRAITSFTSWIPLYLGTGLALAVAALAFVGMFVVLARLAGPQLAQAPGRWLRWSWVLLALALVLPALGRWVLPARGTQGPVEVWQGGRARADWGPAPLHLQLDWAAAPAAASTRSSRWTLGLEAAARAARRAWRPRCSRARCGCCRASAGCTGSAASCR